MTPAEKRIALKRAYLKTHYSNGPTQENAQKFIDKFRATPLHRAGDAMVSAMGDTMSGGFDDEAMAAVGSLFGAGKYSDLQQSLEAGKRDAQSQSDLGRGTGVGLGLVSIAGPLTKLTEGAIQLTDDALRMVGVTPETATNFAKSALNRVLAAGEVGATTGYVAGKGEGNGDEWSDAMLGGILGLGGEALFRTARGLKQSLFPGPEDVAEKGAARIVNELDPLTGGEMSPDAMINQRQRLGPTAMVADLNPVLQAQAKGAIINGAKAETVGKIVAAARSRAVDDDALIAMSQGLGVPVTREAAAATSKEAMDLLGTRYGNVVKDMDANLPLVGPKMVKQTITSAFGSNPVGGKLAMRDRLLSLVDQKSPGGRPFKPSGLIDIKQEVDKILTGLDGDMLTSSVEKGTRANVAQVRGRMNDYLKSQSSDYADISADYADEFARARARQLGEKTFSNPGSQLAEDADAIYRQMSTSEQQEFERGATYTLFKNAQNRGAVDTLSRVAGTKGGSATMELVERVFGSSTADAMALEADRAATMLATANSLEKAAVKRSGELTKSAAGGNPVGKIGDIITALGTGLTGDVRSGAFYGSTKRSGVAASQHAEGLVNDWMLNFMGQQGDAADSGIAALKSYMTRDLFNQPFNAGVAVNAGLPHQ